MAREAFDEINEGITIGGKLIKEVRFADDKGVLASTEKGLQKLMTSLNRVANRFGMKISIKKTKVLVVTKETNKQVNILISNQKLKQVAHFKYLGSCMTQDGRSSMEIRKRIAMGREAFNGKKTLLTKGLKLHLQKRIVKAVV